MKEKLNQITQEFNENLSNLIQNNNKRIYDLYSSYLEKLMHIVGTVVKETKSKRYFGKDVDVINKTYSYKTKYPIKIRYNNIPNAYFIVDEIFCNSYWLNEKLSYGYFVDPIHIYGYYTSHEVNENTVDNYHKDIVSMPLSNIPVEFLNGFVNDFLAEITPIICTVQ